MKCLSIYYIYRKLLFSKLISVFLGTFKYHIKVFGFNSFKKMVLKFHFCSFSPVLVTDQTRLLVGPSLVIGKEPSLSLLFCIMCRVLVQQMIAVRFSFCLLCNMSCFIAQKKNPYFLKLTFHPASIVFNSSSGPAKTHI